MTMISDHIVWETHPVPSTAANGTMQVRIGRVGSGGPVGLLVASQHGDEGPWGTRAIRKMLERTPIEELRGSLRIVPVANPMAFEENMRESHIDRNDLNMEFPGDPNGQHTQRLAYVLGKHAVDGVDVVLDVHGGGSWCMNCFVYRFPGSEDLAEWIGAPFIRNGPSRGTTSLTGHAMAQGAKGVWIEVGGAGAHEELWAGRVADGLRRALGKTGVLTAASLPEPAPAKVLTGGTASFRASMPGLYLPILREDGVATIVPAGTEIGRLLDPVTNEVIENYTAPFDQTVMLLLRPRLGVVEGGEMLGVVSPAE